MSPTLNHGDFILACRFFSLKVNDVIVVDHPIYNRIIKRIDQINPQQKIWLKGDNSTESVSSEQMGWIDPSAVKGKVIYCIKKNRRD